jgi:hypothetical protein
MKWQGKGGRREKKRRTYRKFGNLSQNADTEGPNRLCVSAECSADIESGIFGQIVADNKII